MQSRVSSESEIVSVPELFGPRPGEGVTVTVVVSPTVASVAFTESVTLAWETATSTELLEAE